MSMNDAQERSAVQCRPVQRGNDAIQSLISRLPTHIDDRLFVETQPAACRKPSRT